MARRMNDVYGRAIGLVAAGSFSLAPLVTERFGLASAGAAFSSAATRNGLKVVARHVALSAPAERRGGPPAPADHIGGTCR